jgi:phosphoribosylglycinamide formyltransferase-1
MTRDEPIAIFAYAFPHRKTQDFLIEAALAGYRNVTVIAAPWKKLAHADSESYFPTAIRNAAPADTRDICARLGFDFRELEHSDVDAITALRAKTGFKIGIVSGARIIKRAIIDLFGEGILNIHPGKIPETSGLDLFYYTVKNRVAMGVTAHYIDARVDAGEILFFEETPLSIEATPEIVQHNNYHSQIRALRRFFALRDDGDLAREPANRPFKNQPMSSEEKRQYIGEFPKWLEEQVREQSGRSLHNACRSGDTAKISALLETNSDLIK